MARETVVPLGTCQGCGEPLFHGEDIGIRVVVNGDSQTATFTCVVCLLDLSHWRDVRAQLGRLFPFTLGEMPELPASARSWLETLRGDAIRRRANRNTKRG